MMAKRDVLGLGPAAMVGGLSVRAGAQAHGGDLSHEGDEREITALLISYATAIDRRDWKLFANCWTQDAVLDYGTIGRWEGRDAVIEAFDKMHVPFGDSLHRMSNIVIAVNGDNARASSYVDAVLIQPKPKPTVFRGEGWYEDELVRGAGGWKITAREFHAVLMTQTPQ